MIRIDPKKSRVTTATEVVSKHLAVPWIEIQGSKEEIKIK